MMEALHVTTRRIAANHLLAAVALAATVVGLLAVTTVTIGLPVNHLAPATSITNPIAFPDGVFFPNDVF